MKRILLPILILFLILPLAACGEEEENIKFTPQTSQEFFDTVMENFQNCAEYRLRAESCPYMEDTGVVLDLYFSHSEAGLILAGEKIGKHTKTSTFLYGEGTLLGEGPWIRSTNKVTYRQKEAGSPLSLSDVSVGDGSVEEHLLDGFLKDYLSNATLKAEEDGSYTLTISLEQNETLALYDVDTYKSLYTEPSEVTYTADSQGRLTSAAIFLKNLEQVRLNLSYEDETIVKPRWFNSEKPYESEGASSVAVIHELGEGQEMSISQTEEGTVVRFSVSKKGRDVITVPDHIPENVIYGIESSNGVEEIIISRWSSETRFPPIIAVDVFFIEGERPEGNTDRRMHFEGEWKMVDGVPKVTKRY